MKIHFHLFHENKPDLRGEMFDVIQRDVNSSVSELYDIVLENTYKEIIKKIGKMNNIYEITEFVEDYNNKQFHVLILTTSLIILGG